MVEEGLSKKLGKLAGRADPFVLVAALAAVFSLYQMLPPGLPEGADPQLHLFRVVELDQAIRGGVPFPR